MERRIYYVGVRADEFKRNVFLKCGVVLAAAVFIMVAIMLFALRAQASYYEDELATMQSDYEYQIEAVHASYQSEISTYEAEIAEVDTLVYAMENKLNEKQADSAELFEIARKYWYVFRDAPDNSGLTMDDMVYLDSLCKDYDLNPHIMWCIYDNESGYTEVIDNFSGSSARGLGQVLASTGKSMYENVLQLGSYTHELAYDAQINMQITTALIARNVDSGLYNAIALYSGDSTGGYYNTIQNIAIEHGVDISNTSYQ